ncbi:MAG: tRNA1(Val) (adenine(37)-N6)-methyltransferase [Clostridiaceae bacterium]|nr:tRNA1(Val) (adenine(37)-N6)-methyltransferase [Clostridiaceae bacterium]
MNFTVLPDETLEDLQINNLFILQKKDTFRFGMDAILLSNFVTAGKGTRILDLGTGTGIIPILLSAKTQAGHITGIDIQADIVDMAKRSVRGNMLEAIIEIIECDIKKVIELLKPASYDIVVTNPPYMRAGSGFVNPEQGKAIARHEIFCTLQDVLSSAASMLKPNGEFFMVNRPDRLADALEGMRRVKLEPKVLRLVSSKYNSAPNLFLIKAIKNGNPGLKIMPNLIIYNQDGQYTEELKVMYNIKN